MLLLKALVGLLAFLLLLALAVAGLAAAVFSIAGDGAILSLSQLAEWLRLPELRDGTGAFLTRLEDDSVDAWAALSGIAAVIVGILLILGVLGRRRSRAVALEPTGHLKARRRALADVATDLAARTPGISAARSRVRGRRRAVIAVDAAHTPGVQPEEARRAVSRSVAGLTETGTLRQRVRARTGGGRERVQ